MSSEVGNSCEVQETRMQEVLGVGEVSPLHPCFLHPIGAAPGSALRMMVWPGPAASAQPCPSSGARARGGPCSAWEYGYGASLSGFGSSRLPTRLGSAPCPSAFGCPSSAAPALVGSPPAAVWWGQGAASDKREKEREEDSLQEQGGSRQEAGREGTRFTHSQPRFYSNL